jgi:hypothetical protein
VPFLLLLHRFHADAALLSYIEKYTKVALSLFMRAATTPAGGEADKDDPVGHQARKRARLSLL